MGKSKKNRAAANQSVQQSSGMSAEAFSFGDPIPVLDRRELLDYVECVQMDRWYEPPVSFDGLARTYRAAVHHSSPIAVKRDILSSTYIPHRLLSQQAFARFVQDYLVFGNAYLEKRTKPARRRSLAGASTGEVYTARRGPRHLLVCAVWHDHAAL
ncbi:putative phage portal protein [Enterobacter cloacae]|uniref:Putative phage portal protein n=1 Tax=Enterobacter cloacae TaxID=550 RepID=A0A377LT23_ENTCL|nr:putative phage portal protein [Enterobacter cloacae]